MQLLQGKYSAEAVDLKIDVPSSGAMTRRRHCRHTKARIHLSGRTPVEEIRLQNGAVLNCTPSKKIVLRMPWNFTNSFGKPEL
jgi:hypothetical protein